MTTPQLGLIGAGQMGQALASGWLSAGLIEPARLHAFDPLPATLKRFGQSAAGVQLHTSNAEVAESADVLVLAVKPQSMAAVCDELRGRLAGKLVVSVAAGVTLGWLTVRLGVGRVIRVMPNTPCLIGQGASAYALAPGADQADADLVERLLAAVGRVRRVEERLLDAVTGLSGSGPAFVCLLIEALADGGVRMGLPRDAALELAAQTVRGAAQLVLESGEHPAVLKDRVASPGGTTIAGLQVLEERAVRGAMIAAVEAAARRGAELGRLE